MKPVFEFKDYRAYLSAALPTKGEARGGRVKLADALRIQKAYVSSVLHCESHFSLEQALQVSEFLGHSETETEYFLLLVQMGRAGSKALENRFRKKIEAFLDQRRQISARIQARSEFSETDRLVYYSNWRYTAVHMCLMIQALRTPEAISRYLGLPLPATRRVLEFFLETGIATVKDGAYAATETRMHIPANSPFIHKHHTNWRMQAIQSLDRDGSKDMHYSLIMSISADAAEKIRTILLSSIQQMEPVMKEAKDERVYGFCLDLFDLSP